MLRDGVAGRAPPAAPELRPPELRSVAVLARRAAWLPGPAAWRGLVGLVLFALAWEGLARLKLINSLFFPTFGSIAAATWDMYASGAILPHLGYTMANFAVGFVIGSLIGVPLGLVLGWHRRLLQYLDPLLSIALATPVIVLVPLVISVFGIFWQSKVVITIWAVFLPVLVSMIAGVQAADSGLVKVARSFQATDGKIIRDVILPGAVPSLVGGLRLGLARGLIGVLAAEFFGSPRGLGYLAFNYSTTFQPAKMFVAVLTMAAVAILLTEAIKVVQRRFDAWRPDQP